jgi:hypothetical protein
MQDTHTCAHVCVHMIVTQVCHTADLDAVRRKRDNQRRRRNINARDMSSDSDLDEQAKIDALFAEADRAKSQLALSVSSREYASKSSNILGRRQGRALNNMSTGIAQEIAARSVGCSGSASNSTCNNRVGTPRSNGGSQVKNDQSTSGAPRTRTTRSTADTVQTQTGPEQQMRTARLDHFRRAFISEAPLGFNDRYVSRRAPDVELPRVPKRRRDASPQASSSHNASINSHVRIDANNMMLPRVPKRRTEDSASASSSHGALSVRIPGQWSHGSYQHTHSSSSSNAHTHGESSHPSDGSRHVNHGSCSPRGSNTCNISGAAQRPLHKFNSPVEKQGHASSRRGGGILDEFLRKNSGEEGQRVRPSPLSSPTAVSSVRPSPLSSPTAVSSVRTSSLSSPFAVPLPSTSSSAAGQRGSFDGKGIPSSADVVRRMPSAPDNSVNSTTSTRVSTTHMNSALSPRTHSATTPQPSAGNSTVQQAVGMIGGFAHGHASMNRLGHPDITAASGLIRPTLQNGHAHAQAVSNEGANQTRVLEQQYSNMISEIQNAPKGMRAEHGGQGHRPGTAEQASVNGNGNLHGRANRSVNGSLNCSLKGQHLNRTGHVSSGDQHTEGETDAKARKSVLFDSVEFVKDHADLKKAYKSGKMHKEQFKAVCQSVSNRLADLAMQTYRNEVLTRFCNMKMQTLICTRTYGQSECRVMMNSWMSAGSPCTTSISLFVHTRIGFVNQKPPNVLGAINMHVYVYVFMSRMVGLRK